MLCVFVVHVCVCVQVFHWSMFYQEYYRIWCRLGQLKALFFSILMWFLSFFYLTARGSSRVGMHTLFGDGSTIPERTIAHVRDTVWRNMVFNRWEKGDILMIDNFRISHGRQVNINMLYFSPFMLRNRAVCRSFAKGGENLGYLRKEVGRSCKQRQHWKTIFKN